MISLNEPYNINRARELNTVLKMAGFQVGRVFGEVFHEAAVETQIRYWGYFLIHFNEQMYGRWKP